MQLQQHHLYYCSSIYATVISYLYNCYSSSTSPQLLNNYFMYLFFGCLGVHLVRMCTKSTHVTVKYVDNGNKIL